MNPAPRSLIVGLLFAVSLGCSGDEKKKKKEPLTAESCPALPLGPYQYAADKAPQAPVPEGAGLEALPLALQGADNGDMSVLYGAAMMGYYMIGVQRPTSCKEDSGKPCMPYLYQYDPRTDAPTTEEMIHRQVVGALGQAWLYKVTGRPEFGLSAKGAVDVLLPRSKVDADGRRQLQDLGATALMVMTLSQLDIGYGTRNYSAELDSFGKQILHQQRPNGSFKAGSPLVWMQLHNALWRLYDYTQDPAYLEALAKAAKNAYDRRAERAKGQYFEYPYLYGLWALEPLTELVAVRPAEAAWISELVYFVADDVAGAQYDLSNTTTCKYVGGFKPNNGKGHPNWNHTIKLEAVADAYRYAKQAGDAERTARYKASALAGAAYLLQFQHRAGDTGDYPNKIKPIGGVPLFGGDPSVRIDIPGHGAVAMLKVATYIGDETVPGRVIPGLPALAAAPAAAPEPGAGAPDGSPAQP